VDEEKPKVDFIDSVDAALEELPDEVLEIILDIARAQEKKRRSAHLGHQQHGN